MSLTSGSSLVNNTVAHGSGGGLFNWGGTAEIDGALVSGNSVLSGEGLYGSGGGVFNLGGQLFMSACEMSTNFAANQARAGGRTRGVPGSQRRWIHGSSSCSLLPLLTPTDGRGIRDPCI